MLQAGAAGRAAARRLRSAAAQQQPAAALPPRGRPPACRRTAQAARLRDAEPALQRAAERAAATASVSDKVQLNAAAEERRAQLRQQEVGPRSAPSMQQQQQHKQKPGSRAWQGGPGQHQHTHSQPLPRLPSRTHITHI